MSKCSGSQLGLHQLPSASNSANFCNNTDINKKLDTQKKIYEQHLLVKGVKERIYLYIRFAPDVMSGPGPGWNPAVF